MCTTFISWRKRGHKNCKQYGLIAVFSYDLPRIGSILHGHKEIDKKCNTYAFRSVSYCSDKGIWSK